ncbi:hypothetical protein M758_3G087800 [Ceratodon purpureus]|nr:hypothetical protein M758_3G087800 [Ceratodon purpureus]
MGSTLFDKTSIEDGETIWLELVDALKESADVMDMLRWSYNNLLSVEKRMFVDITCLFYNKSKAEALTYWRSCRHCGSCDGIKTPEMSLRNLMDKNMVHQGRDGILQVHDLLRDLGHDIGKDLKSHLICHNKEDGVALANQGTHKTMVLNLERSQKKHFEAKTFGKMSNLHSLILPHGGMIDGDLDGMSKELRMLQWTGMPFSSVPTRLNLHHILSLDFSDSSDMAFLWTELTTNFEGHPNLQRLHLAGCTSITKLPDSIGQSSHLQELYLSGCESLERLPESIGQLKALQVLNLDECRSLKALPDSIGALSNLTHLSAQCCESLVKLPSAIGMLSTLEKLSIDSASPECQVSADGNIGEAWTRLWWLSLGSSGGLGSLVDYGALKSLQWLDLGDSTLTEIPESLGQLRRLSRLEISCERLQCLPNSITGLTMLEVLRLSQCHNLKRLPKALGTLTTLETLRVECCPISKLPKSIGALSRLQRLRVAGCKNLQKLPSSVRQLHSLRLLELEDCGGIEAMGAMASLQGLPIWGSTSITKLPAALGIVSTLVVYDTEYNRPWEIRRYRDYAFLHGTTEVLEEDESGYLKACRHKSSGQIHLLRGAHKKRRD